MDFFEHQDRARRKTGQLVFLFIVGLVATTIAINLMCFLLFYAFDVFFTAKTVTLGESFANWWGSNLNWQISIGVLAVIAIGTFFRFLELSDGGRSVASCAGAQPVDMSSRDPKLKQLINVCEEMAIAAGMPVPELFVMNRETSINAFVAGYRMEESVLVVTRGTLEQLTRDELQGVIGHEYSHILNGDMRLNVRLMMALAGLILVGQIGRFLVDTSFYRSAYSNKESGGVAILSFIGGLSLIVMGYIGVLVGRMIKAGVSRQREFLADASSVQFTRNPDAIAGALYAIKESVEGSQLHHKHAEDMSHFCFGESVALNQALATHPPLLERIKRVNPKYLTIARSKRRKTESAEQSIARSQPVPMDPVQSAIGFAVLAGSMSQNHVDFARDMYQHIPEQVKEWVHQSYGARAYFYAQVLHSNEEHKDVLLKELQGESDEVKQILKRMWPFVKKMDPQLRIPILELAIPTLKRLDANTRKEFIGRLSRMIKQDQHVNFTEWVLVTLLKLRLKTAGLRDDKYLKSKIDPFFPALHTLFKSVVEQNPDRHAAEKVYEQVCARFGMTYESNTSLNDVKFDQLEKALDELNKVSFVWRGVVLEACADILKANGHIALNEYEMIRIISDCLQCPIPPLIIDKVWDEDDGLPPIEFSMG